MRLPRACRQILGWLNQNDERSPDLLLHRLFQRLGKAYPGTLLLHPEPYGALLESLDLKGPAQHDALMHYLGQWYANAHDCYWHERHTWARSDHLGYWAFEAALVAFLWSVQGDGLE
uniref:PoNe immunity protein domain-containing protein n=1 Tax=Pseudomonas sp. 79_C TaxID=2813567 RepID=UPI00325FDF33